MTPLEIALVNFRSALIGCASQGQNSAAILVWKRWADDLHEMVLSSIGAWDALSGDYRGAWIGELKRRNQVYGIDPEATVRGVSPQALRQDVRDALREIGARSGTLTRTPVNRAPFSQYCINMRFASQAGGSPAWLASKTIKECAVSLRNDPAFSETLRITLTWHAGQWMCLNNRGMALHALAAVEPRRLVFRDHLNSEETGRAAVDPNRYILNWRDSIPSARRDRRRFWNVFPTAVVAVLEGSPTNNQGDPVAKDVLFTIANPAIDVGDRGNQEVFVSR